MYSDYESDAARSFYKNPFYFRPTTVVEYALWVRVWVETGHTKIEERHQLFGQFDRMVTPVRNVTLVPAYGAASVDLYIPKGIKVNGNPGHGKFFTFDENDMPVTTDHRVTIYDDPEFSMSRKILTQLVINQYEDEVFRLKSELLML